MAYKTTRIIVIIICALFLMACSHGRKYKIYIFDSERKLFIRDLKSGDTLNLEQADGLMCMPKTDARNLFEELATRKAYGR